MYRDSCAVHCRLLRSHLACARESFYRLPYTCTPNPSRPRRFRAPSPRASPSRRRVCPQAQGLQFTLRDLTPQAQGLVEVVRGVGQRWSASHVVDVFRGSQSQAVGGGMGVVGGRYTSMTGQNGMEQEASARSSNSVAVPSVRVRVSRNFTTCGAGARSQVLAVVKRRQLRVGGRGGRGQGGTRVVEGVER